MKKKVTKKKLSLGKVTVLNLEDGVTTAKGGIHHTAPGASPCVSWDACPTVFWYNCPTVWGVDPNPGCLPPID